MKSNFTEIIINAAVTSFGSIGNKYSGIKINCNCADGELDISPMLQDENNEEAIYITLNKEQCLILAIALKTFAKSMK